MSSEQLPVAQLESLKYRATQIMESIATLQFLVEANGQPAMPSWPDILARYNLLLSQTHSLSVSLLSALVVHQHHLGVAPPQNSNPFQKLVLYPGVAVPEQQLDNLLAPLLRNQPTVQVLRAEDQSVRRVASVLKSGAQTMSTTEQVVQECAEIRKAHDARVERAAKAVALLRERYEWRVRVESEPEGDKERGRREIDGDRDVTMAEPAVHAGVDEGGDMGLGADPRMSEGSSPASQRTDEANEAREMADVLGEVTTHG